MSAGHRKHVDHCLNCAAPTPGAYCPACGQEAVDAAVTFRDQIAHFFEEVFTVEARLPQTVKILVMRPGALTRAYNSGQRVRFVTPLKLYLLASVTFFLLLSLSASRAAPELHSQPAVQGGQTTAEGFSLRIVPPPGEKPRDTPTVAPIKTPEEFDAWLANPKNAKAFPPFLLPHIRALLKSPNGFVGSLIDLCSKATIALVPIHALLLTLAYCGARRLYGEHIVFSLHLHSFAYLAYAVATLVSLVASEAIGSAANGVALLCGAAYAVVAARTAYAEGWVRSTVKMAAVGLGYGVALMGVIALASTWAFFAA